MNGKSRRGRGRQHSTRRQGSAPNGAGREAIIAALANTASPLGADALAEALGVGPQGEREALERRVEALVRDGVLVRNRRGEYGLVQRMDLIRGRVIGHPDGFGFVAPEDGDGDLFLPAFEMRRVLHGDRVVVRVSGVDRRGRRQGAIVEVLERANRQVVGRYFREGGIGFVVPANTRLSQEVLIPAEASGGAHPGQIVVAAIVEQPDAHRQPRGEVTEVLGEHMAPGMEVDIALRVHEIPYAWPGAVREELAAVPDRVRDADLRGRTDLRALPLVTIDGADARDYDDAIYCEPHADGFRLVVAIADVAHYVRPGTVLDAEARERGTSVYFPNRVIPMLPPELSNGICSLVPLEDRLCFACELQFDRRGALREYRFFDAVMCSAARLTYDEVAQAVVERDPLARERLEPLVRHLDDLYRLYRHLRRRRERRGAIDFDTMESRIEFDEQGKIARIVPLQRNEAHMIIEECMIAANVAAASLLAGHEQPALYRVHKAPSAERLEDLRAFLGELGLRLPGRKAPTPKDYGQVLAQVGERPDRHLIQTVLLRSMKMAVYSPDNAGHFGLALDAYTHFTSPIRRYPDLLVHRAIRRCQRRRGAEYPYDAAALGALGEHCSMAERRADDATRDVVAWLKCEYMSDRVGESFDGAVSAVTGFGLFVELSEVFVEGLVHITALPSDYYHFDPVGHRLTGERSGRVFRLLDPVRVRLVRVDIEERKIDFELLGDPAAPRRRRRRK